MSEPRIGLVLSIRPRFVQGILSGEKTVEIRRVFHSKWIGAPILLYASAPRMAALGVVTLGGVEQLTISELWATHGPSTGSTREEVDRYFAGRPTGYALLLTDAKRFERAVTLCEMRERFGTVKPPQSYAVIRSRTAWEWALESKLADQPSV